MGTCQWRVQPDATNGKRCSVAFLRHMVPAVLTVGVACRVAAAAPESLTTERRVNPVGIDACVPRLSWQLPAGTKAQTAYEIDMDGEFAKSAHTNGRRLGGQHIDVAWPGAVLTTGSRHTWRVRTWDENNVPSEWSALATFTVGVMKPADWKAKWIAAAASTRPDEDMGAAQWITAPADAKGVVTLSYAFDFAGAKPGEFVDVVHAGVAQHTIEVNGKSFNLPCGQRHDWRYARFRDMTRWLVKGRNEIVVRVYDEPGRPGEPLPKLRVPAPAGVHAFLAKIVLPDGRTLVTDKSWSSPNGAVQELGKVRDTPYGRQLVLRADTTSPAFAKTFTVADKPIRSAVLQVTGVGFCETHLNGVKIGDKVLDPSPTAYDKRVLYSTYNLDEALKPGANTLELLVGHGWYDVRAVASWNYDTAPWRDFPRAIAQLEIVYADGDVELVATDRTWRQVRNPVGYDDIREGEVIGAWDRAMPDLEKTVVLAEEVPGPGGKLVAEAQPAAKVMREVRASRVKDLGDGACLIAFPENLAGWIRLTLRGQRKGDVVTLRYDERANADLTPALDSVRDGLSDFTFSNLRETGAEVRERRKIDAHFRYTASHRVCPIDAGFQVDRFVSSGSPVEVYEPRFTYNGFRYVYVRGLAQLPKAEDIVGCMVHTSFATTGRFACSDETLNQLMLMADRAYRCNFVDGVPTDCPHREKNGWTGDASVAAQFAQYRFENTAGYEKWLRDIGDAQLPDGNVPGIVPTSGWGYHWGNGPAWDSALPVVAWNLWRYRGDRAILDEVYPVLVKLLAYTATKADANGLVRHGLGDWVPVDRKHMPETEYTSSCYYHQAQRIAAEIAKVKGLPAEAAKFDAAAEKTRAGIQAKYYKGNGVYSNGRQTAQAVALTFGIVPATERAAAAARLVEAVEKEQGHVDVGLIGMKHVFRALSEIGRTDLAFQMLTNPTSPSPVEWIQKGGTTLWEDWGDGASRNHIMFGDFAAWAYQYLAGIRLAPAADSTPAVPTGAPGFTEILLAPCPIAALAWAEGETTTPQGVVKSAWRRTGGKIDYAFTVPPGATAEIRLPGEAPLRVAAGTYTYSR